jgi:uncharacterized membrane protein
LLVVLVIAEVFFSPYAVTSRGLLGGGWTRTAGIFGVVGSLSALAVYAVSADTGGAMGVAVGSAVMYGALSATSFCLLRKRLAQTEILPLTGTISNGRQP